MRGSSACLTGVLAAIALAGCGSGGGASMQSDAPAQRATPAPTASTKAEPATARPNQGSTTETSPTTAAPPARRPAHARQPHRPSHAGSLASACRDARRLHPSPRRPAAPSGLKAYALASVPATQATLAALNEVHAQGQRAAALSTAYAALLSLYQQLAAAPAAEASRLAPGLKSLERIVGAQARAAGLPACAPPAA